MDQRIEGHNNLQAGRDINATVVTADAVQDLLARRPSIVANVIASLAQKTELTAGTGRTSIDPYEIQHKIDFNNVKAYRELFERYSGFGSVIDTVCDELDVDEPGIKRRLFEFVAHAYLEVKGAYEADGSDVQDVADDIITQVREKLRTLALSDGVTESVSQEDIELSITALVTKAFIDCKLLEHPPTI